MSVLSQVCLGINVGPLYSNAVVGGCGLFVARCERKAFTIILIRIKDQQTITKEEEEEEKHPPLLLIKNTAVDVMIQTKIAIEK